MPSNKSAKRIAKLKGTFWYLYSGFTLRHTPLCTLFLKKQISALGVNKLHVGCGHILLPGWLNITFENRIEYGKIKQNNGALFLNYNLMRWWPFEENSVDFIAASHFIEHFDLNQGIDFAKKCFAVLRKGGVIRLSCPDLELYARNYAAKNQEFFENPLIREWCCFENAKTPGEIFIAKAYDSGGSHKWFYDFESLRHILEAAGFRNAERKTRLEGRTPDLEKLEMDKRELETVYIEAVKE